MDFFKHQMPIANLHLLQLLGQLLLLRFGLLELLSSLGQLSHSSLRLCLNKYFTSAKCHNKSQYEDSLGRPD